MRLLAGLALAATLIGIALPTSATDAHIPVTYKLTLVLSTTSNHVELHVLDGVLLVDAWRVDEKTGQMSFQAWDAIRFSKSSKSLSRMSASIDVRVISYDPEALRLQLDAGTYGKTSLEIRPHGTTEDTSIRTIVQRGNDSTAEAEIFDIPLSALSEAAAPDEMSIDVTSRTYCGYEIYRSVPYASIPGVEKVEQMSLDLYLPPRNAERPPPLIIWIHGGGWWKGDKGEQRAVDIFGSRYAVASINYRLAPDATFPAQIHDCKAAARWLRAHALEYGYHPDRFGVLGESAGAHLALLLALGSNEEALEGTVGEHLDRSSAVQAACVFAGPSDLFTYRDSVPESMVPGLDAVVSDLLGGSLSDVPELADLGSPLRHVDGDDPPCLIVHGDEDKMVGLSQSNDLLDVLLEAGVPAELHILEGHGHCMAKWPMDTVVAPIIRSFFEQVFASPADNP